MRHGPVTTLGLGQDPDGSYVFVTSEGEVVPGPLLAIGNTTIRVDFGGDPGRLGRRSGARPASATTGPLHRTPRGRHQGSRVPAGHRTPAGGGAMSTAARLLPTPGQTRTHRRVHAPATPPSGRTCSRPSKASGWNNYSLFLRADGLLIGYFETDSRSTTAQARDGSAPTSTPAGRPRWPDSSSTSTEPPTQGFLQLTEVFHLEDQLAALDAAAASDACTAARTSPLESSDS